MTIERAIEILDPEHREHYESIEIVNEACRMGIDALKQVEELKAENDTLKERLSKAIECKYKVGDKIYIILFDGDETFIEEHTILEIVREKQSFFFKIGERENIDVINPDFNCMFDTEEECKEYLEKHKEEYGFMYRENDNGN